MPATVSANQSQNLPILRISTPTGARLRWLDHGKPGNFQTAAEMALLVRDAAMRDEGLCAFAAGLLIRAGLDSHSSTDQILDCVFRFVQDRVKYIADPGGNFDAISSARETLTKKPVPYGDCDDLSVLLASLLACLGFEPSFVLAKYRDDENGFDHIYVQVEDSKGNVITLDPTSRTHGMGWESPRAIEKAVFPIFGKAGSFNSLAGAVQLAETGAMIGLNFVPVVGPFLSALVMPIASLFDKTRQRSEEAARWQGHEQVMQAMDQIQSAIDSCQLTPTQGADMARQVVTAYYAAMDASLSKKVAQSARNYGSEPGGFDYRISQISTRMNPSCALASPPIAASQGTVSGGAQAVRGGTVSDGGLGGLSTSVSPSTAVLLLLGGGLLLMKAFK